MNLGEIFHSLNSAEFLKTFLKRRLTISENSASNIRHEAFCDRLLKSCSVSHNMLCLQPATPVKQVSYVGMCFRPAVMTVEVI